MTKSKKENWSAVILAGGLGSRLMPLTTNICKPMVSVTNCPMIEYAIEHLRYAGIKRIVVCVKKFGEKLRAQIKEFWPQERQDELGVEILIPNLDSKGTADAVRLAGDLIKTEHFIVSMADIVTNLPLEKFMAFHEKKDAYATISMKKIEQMATKYGNTLIDRDGKIIRFLEKPSSEEIYLSALTGGTSASLPIINTGIYCFKRDLIEFLKGNDFMDFGHEVFPFLLENKYALYGFVEDYYWLDIGNPQTYLWANWDMLRLYGWPVTPYGKRQDSKHLWFIDSEKPPEHVKLGNNIEIGKNNTYGNNVHLKDLVSIGSNCTFGSNILIDRSVVWDNVVIGDNCRIENTIICNDCVIGDDCTIKSDTVIGPECEISPGTVLDSKTIEADKNI